MTQTLPLQKTQTYQIPAWRLWLPLLIQIGVILAIPSVPIYIHITGKTVILETLPVDPYDPLRGYSQTLAYNISTVNGLKNLTGGKEVTALNNTIYVILQSPFNQAKIPRAWAPVSISTNLPKLLPQNQIALKGKVTQDGQIKYGLESYYMPENRQREINRAISNSQSIVMETKIDTKGRAIPLALWIGKERYSF